MIVTISAVMITTHKNNGHNDNPTEFVIYQSILLYGILRNGGERLLFRFMVYTGIEIVLTFSVKSS